MTRNAAHGSYQLGAAMRQLALAAVVGGLGACGTPGIELVPLYPLALILLSFLAARIDSWLGAALLGATCVGSAGAVVTIAAISWGGVVPVALTLIGAVLCGVPLGVLAHWSSRRFEGIRAFVAVGAAWSLVVEFAAWVGFPIHGEAMSAVAYAPMLLGGIRLFGIPCWCGLFVAGLVGTGTACAKLRALSSRGALSAARPLAASLALLLAASGVAHMFAPAAQGSISVGVPQLNIPSEYFKFRQGLPATREALNETFETQRRALENVDLLVLPETYDGTFPLFVPRLRSRFQTDARLEHQAILLTSYLVAEDGGGYNAVGAIDRDGHLTGVHRKVNLAPFGEGELDAGTDFRPLPVLPGVAVGALICQEAIIAQGPRTLARAGANLLATATSDVSFGSGMLPFAHLAYARLRAIEVGRDMIWASGAGPSGVLTRWGNFQSAAPFREAAAVEMRAELHDDLTPFLRSSWLWPWLSAAFFLAVCVSTARTETVQISPDASIKRLSAIRGMLELSMAGVFVLVLAVCSPALVEIRKGHAARARASIAELFTSASPIRETASLARFRTDDAHSEQGALAFLLDYYGFNVVPSNIQPLGTTASLADASRTLAFDYGLPSTEIPLDFTALPRSAVLVRTKGGRFAVLAASRGPIVLFDPVLGSQRLISRAGAHELLQPNALIPVGDGAR